MARRLVLHGTQGARFSVMTDQEQQALSRQVAEQSRESAWRGSSFLREVFLGKLRLELLPAGGATPSERPEFREFYRKLHNFLEREVQPSEIDRLGEYPLHVVSGLRELGAFGLKIPREYGGLGFNHGEYVEVMQLLGSFCGNLTALLSAHQSIGVPHPVELFGSEELKRKYLPRCAEGAISAFALTEPAVGSDPARLASIARKSDDGEHYVLDGKKLWCTNGTLAEVVVVLARDPDTKRINCFVVETDWPGVRVEQRCHFMGLRALANGVLTFDQVRVPKENLVGNEGDGLRIALATLNTGRLTLPAATAGAAKVALEICRKWSLARVQWGVPIGKHEAVAHGLAELAANAYAMESLARTVGALADMPDRDIRIEAAAAKEWNTCRGWELTDRALQIRGGRGYETEASLQARGEPPIGIERMLRDCRINLIFEGSSEIMHLFIAREAVDKHLEVAGALIDPKLSLWQKLRALPKVIAFYALWYPAQWLPQPFAWRRLGRYEALAPYARFAAVASRRLARSIFHGMLRFGPKLERKQAFLFRAVDIGLELFALAATLLRADQERATNPSALELADDFARGARRRIEDKLRDMWDNDDREHVRLANELLEGRFLWLEQGTMGVPYEVAELAPETMENFFETQEAARAARSGAERLPRVASR
jgi:alkylation response protein AidB-like acyl-CoA dehydrogenase